MAIIVRTLMYGLLLAGLLAFLAFAVFAGSVASLMTASMSEYDEREWEPDPRHLGHRDVLVVDSVDSVVRRHVVVDYAGRYSADPRWPDGLRAVEEGIPAALRDVRERLGLEAFADPPFVVRFRDNEQMGGNVFMSTFQEIRAGEAVPLIVVGVDSLLAGEFHVGDALHHEIVHCFHLAALGEHFYEQPRWIQEGIADWGTGRGAERLQRLYLTNCAEDGFAPENILINGLEGGHTRLDYGEDFLAIAYLESIVGVEGVRTFVSALFGGTSPDIAMAGATGMSFADFKNRARVWSRECIRLDVADRPLYLVAKKAFLDHEFEAADRAYGRFLELDRHRAFRAIALVEQAECRIETGDWAGASALLDAADAEETAGPFRVRIQYDRVLLAHRRGEWDSVESRAVQFVETCRALDGPRTRKARGLLEDVRERKRSGRANGDAAHPDPEQPPSSGTEGR